MKSLMRKSLLLAGGFLLLASSTASAAVSNVLEVKIPFPFVANGKHLPAGQYMIQDLVNIPVDVDYASEFEYRNPLIGPGELTIVITQSGETADTTAAQREAKAKGSRTIAISNVVDSTIAREADGVLYTHAGPEISIASTKAFTAQMAVLYLFALYLGQVRGKFAKEQRRQYIHQLLEMPGMPSVGRR